MAARRIRTYSPIQVSLKNGYQNAVVFTPFQRIVPTLARVRPIYFIDCGAVHDIDNERIRIKTAILKNQSEVIHGAQCIVKIYGIDTSTLVETLIYTAPTQTAPDADGYFRTSITEANLSQEIQGDFDYVLEVSIKRFKKVFKKRFYFNQLGLADKVERLRKKVVFLQITKRDFGV